MTCAWFLSPSSSAGLCMLGGFVLKGVAVFKCGGLEIRKRTQRARCAKGRRARRDIHHGWFRARRSTCTRVNCRKSSEYQHMKRQRKHTVLDRHNCLPCDSGTVSTPKILKRPVQCVWSNGYPLLQQRWVKSIDHMTPIWLQLSRRVQLILILHLHDPPVLLICLDTIRITTICVLNGVSHEMYAHWRPQQLSAGGTERQAWRRTVGGTSHLPLKWYPSIS
jgi:hypothetical protein